MFGKFGPTEILLIAIVVLVLFGRGKVSSLMGEVGRGITAFRQGIRTGIAETAPADEDPATGATTAPSAPDPAFRS